LPLYFARIFYAIPSYKPPSVFGSGPLEAGLRQEERPQLNPSASFDPPLR
jgi:hypothetical protein